MKTYKTYESAIKEKYINDKKNGLLRPDLYKLTRATLRKICLNLIDEHLSLEDEKTMRFFFEINEKEDIRLKIKNYDIDGFRPICKFLEGKTESIKQHYAIELIAIIVAFEPRPYRNYRIDKSRENNEGSILAEKIPKSTDTYSGCEEKDSIAKSGEKNIFSWFNTVTAINNTVFKILFTATLLLIITIVILNTNSTPNWMIWKNDHYEAVTLDIEKQNLKKLKRYKEDRILNFKKIIPQCDSTIFFNKDGSVNLWYGKNAKGELEYFTDLGLHPETGKTLKAISTHMINKYICN